MGIRKIPHLDEFEWQKAVSSILNTPPGSPSKGDRHIVGTSPTGDFVGHDNAIATFVTSWEYTTPTAGFTVFITGLGKLYLYNGSTWAVIEGVLALANLSEKSYNSLTDKPDLSSLHAAVTILDSNSVDFGLTGQQITADVKIQDSTSVDLSIDASGLKAVVLPAGVDHNSLLNYASNRHFLMTDINSIYLDNAGLKIKDTNASHGLTIKPGSDLTADRILTITTGDAARTITLNGDTTLSGTNTGDQDLSGYALKGANTDLTSVYLNNTGLKIKDTNASHGLTIKPGSDLTADRILTITTGDAARTITLNGDTTLSGTNTGDQDLSAYVAKSLYDANTILYATTDNTPAALTVGERTIVGRITGGAIAALTATQVKTLLAIAQADVSGLTTASTPTFSKLTLNGSTNALTISPESGHGYAIINAVAASEAGVQIQSAGTTKWWIYRPGSSDELAFYNSANRVIIRNSGIMHFTQGQTIDKDKSISFMDGANVKAGIIWNSSNSELQISVS